MILRIPVMGDSLAWIIVAEKGLWYPVVDRVLYNSVELRWRANYTDSHNRLFEDVVRVKREDDTLVMFVSENEVGSLDILSGEIFGLCYPKFELEWNNCVLSASFDYSRECRRSFEDILKKVSKEEMLQLLPQTHKLSRETKEEAALAMSRLWVFNHGGLLC